MMSLPKELLDGVEALVRRFGFSKFQEAVTAVSFSPAASTGQEHDGWWWADDDLVIRSGTSTMEGQLALLQKGHVNSEVSKNIVLRITKSLRVSETDQIIKAMAFTMNAG
jgi:hypothetical protein